jgi:hypothetical protein
VGHYTQLICWNPYFNNFFLGLASVILLISTSLVAGITGMSHHTQLLISYLIQVDHVLGHKTNFNRFETWNSRVLFLFALGPRLWSNLVYVCWVLKCVLCCLLVKYSIPVNCLVMGLSSPILLLMICLLILSVLEGGVLMSPTIFMTLLFSPYYVSVVSQFEINICYSCFVGCVYI